MVLFSYIQQRRPPPACAATPGPSLQRQPSHMAEEQALVLPPSDYAGDPGTAVGGRVVLVRKTSIKGGGKGAGKGGGRGKGASQETAKCEVHLLGGQDMSEMVFVEAWGEAAAAFQGLAQRGRLLVIERAQVVAKRPQYSTSKLPYYLRVQGPIGIRTLVREMPPDAAGASPWVDIPQRHPFVSLSHMPKVDQSLQVC